MFFWIIIPSCSNVQPSIKFFNKISSSSSHKPQFELIFINLNPFSLHNLATPLSTLSNVNTTSIQFVQQGQHSFTFNNYPSCSCIYFVAMLAMSLGEHGAWVQCKHLYHILHNIMYYGYIEKCIHYAMWSWDEVQCLLTHTKVCESQ